MWMCKFSQNLSVRIETSCFPSSGRTAIPCSVSDVDGISEIIVVPTDGPLNWDKWFFVTLSLALTLL